jgi:uncharacterized protein (DUF1778 family)
MSTKAKSAKRETLTIRILSEERGLIDRAARLRGQNRTDFIVQAARRAAEDALLDPFIASGPDAFKAFVRRLDAAPKPNARLHKTMQAETPWG